MTKHTEPEHNRRATDEVDEVIEAGEDLLTFAKAVLEFVTTHRSLFKLLMVVLTVVGPSITAIFGLHLKRTWDQSESIAVVAKSVKIIADDVHDVCLVEQADHPGAQLCRHHDDGQEAKLDVRLTPAVSVGRPSPSVLAASNSHQ